MRTFGLILLTAAVYYVAGRLGLLLAIPPGYATAVWPASGLALAAVLLAGYRVWPGILLGSFLVNAYTAHDASHAEALMQSLGIASIIGMGAALQALAGGWLIKRFVGYRNILTQGLSVITMLLLAGPISCVINASISVTTLWLAGSIPTTNYLFNWWTWWVGDSIGVLVFTPLALIMSLRPSREWRREQIAVAAPLIAVFAAVVWLFVFVSQREELGIRAEFEKWSYSFSHELEKDLGIYRNMLSSLTGLFIGSEVVTKEEFSQFSALILENNSEVQGLSWNPLVSGPERDAFEQAQRAGGYPDYQIYVVDETGSRVPAPPKDSYFPVLYVFPLEENRRALGYDISSEPTRKRAIDLALQFSNRATATGPIKLVQRDGDEYGLLIIEPIYRNHQIKQGLEGFAIVAIQVSDIMRNASSRVADTGLHALAYDNTDPLNPVLIYSNMPEMTKHTPGKNMQRMHTINLAGRDWVIDYHLSEDYLAANPSWQAWSLLATGLLFTALLGIFLLLSIGYTARVTTLVSERTAQLNKSNAALQLEIAERKVLQQEADKRSRQLSEKNEELERFAYVVSHDLQAPLRGIAGFADLLQERYSAKLGAEGREFLNFVSNGTKHMHRMIADILELSRVGTSEMQFKPVDTGAVVQQVCNTLRMDIERSAARVQHESLPTVRADEGQLVLLFQNLVGNAIKFCSKECKPEIRITAQRESEGWHFRVEDNGIGIAEDKQARLFNLFVRLHTTEEYTGTGLGLAICKRIIERHNGHIWLESKQGVGTTFHFVLPATSSDA